MDSPEQTFSEIGTGVYSEESARKKESEQKASHTMDIGEETNATFGNG